MHIDNNDLECFRDNTMEADDMIAFLQHLDRCDYCLEQLLAQETQDTSITTPAYLKGEIMAKASSLEIHVEKTALEKTQKMNIFYEALRTVAGVALALVMLFCIGQNSYTSYYAQPRTEVQAVRTTGPSSHLRDFSRSVSEGLSDGSQIVSQYLNKFSNKIVNGGK